jgi:hypothetical protein
MAEKSMVRRNQMLSGAKIVVAKLEASDCEVMATGKEEDSTSPCGGIHALYCANSTLARKS